MSKRKTQPAVTLTEGELKTVSDLKDIIASYLQAQLNDWKKVEAEEAYHLKTALLQLVPKMRLPKEATFTELELHTISMVLTAALRQSRDTIDKNLFQWAGVPETPVSQENS